MRPKGRTTEQVIGGLAGAAHGVVTRCQLDAAGVTPAEVRQRLASGLLLREHRGVFRVGHRAPSVEARYLAAVRACGERALLSGPAAAHLLGLLKGSPPPPQVTAPTERRVPGVVVRRCRRLDPCDGVVWRGVPTTSVPRTLVDLAAVLDPAALARACHEAGVLHRTTPAQVAAVLARRPAARGAAALRKVVGGEVRVTLSVLEGRFLAVLRTSALPLPQTNRPAGGRRVDCRWPEQRLTVELDSFRFHNTRRAWEEDRRREREARLRGDEFRRFTWAEVEEDPRYMLGELRRLLAREPS